MDESCDKVMLRVRELFAESGLTLDDLGQKMGYVGDTARKAAWQFLNKTADPRLSMLRKFAQAIGASIAELFAEAKRGKTMPRKANKPVTVTSFYRSGKLVDDADEQRRLCKRAARTIKKQAESGANSGEFEVEDGVMCRWQDE